MFTSPPLVLVDGYAMIFRGFYAMPVFTSPAGLPTNAIFAMARFFLAVEKHLPHAYGALTLDKGRCVRRTGLHPEYKAQRPPMPEELRVQMPGIRAWAEAAGWPLVEEEGVEADDLIAGIVRHREGHPVAIITHDKDLAQLVEDEVSILMPGPKESWHTLDRAGVVEKFGVPPEGIRDYLTLVGDTVDNIPGVVGVGPKTAVKLLAQFGSVEALLAAPEAVPSATLREKILASRELIGKNRELVQLHTELPHDWQGLSGIRKREPDLAKLVAFCKEYGFKSLLPHFEKELAARQPKPCQQLEFGF